MAGYTVARLGHYPMRVSPRMREAIAVVEDFLMNPWGVLFFSLVLSAVGARMDKWSGAVLSLAWLSFGVAILRMMPGDLPTRSKVALLVVGMAVAGALLYWLELATRKEQEQPPPPSPRLTVTATDASWKKRADGWLQFDIRMVVKNESDETAEANLLYSTSWAGDVLETNNERTRAISIGPRDFVSLIATPSLDQTATDFFIRRQRELTVRLVATYMSGGKQTEFVCEGVVIPDASESDASYVNITTNRWRTK